MSILNTSQLIRNLTPSAQESLLRPKFRITVPPEFNKGTSSIIGGLIAREDRCNHLRIRFRADIVEPLTEDGRLALDELNDMLACGGDAGAGSIQLDFPASLLPDNTLILMDNGRWLHSRTEVRDPDRHLRRLRWHRQEFGVGDEAQDSFEKERMMLATT